MPDQSTIDLARNSTDQVVARRRAALARRTIALAAHPGKLQLRVQLATAAAPTTTSDHETAGFLVAAGDSWFDYPLHDVLKLLEDNHGYNVESAAHRGDPVEGMAYVNGQLDKFARSMEKVTGQGAVPKAALLSGGGDDIAGKEFGMLLNNATSPIAGWNAEIIDGLLNQRIATAYQTMLHAITNLCQEYAKKTLPILIHGYDYPVPDGRGFLGGWPFPGPWLQPGFAEKLFSDLPRNVALMHDIIDRFNAMLARIVADPVFAHVHYIDLRGTLSADLTSNIYQSWWANELHPTEQGFAAVSDKFAAVLATR
jgi:hypothetical protein